MDAQNTNKNNRERHVMDKNTTASVLPDFDELRFENAVDYRDDRYWRVAGYAAVMLLVIIASLVLLAVLTAPVFGFVAGFLFVPFAACLCYLDSVDKQWVDDRVDEWERVECFLFENTREGQ